MALMSSADEVSSRINTQERDFKLFQDFNVDGIMVAHYARELEVQSSIPGSD